jgi:GAF domain-containing protein
VSVSPATADQPPEVQQALQERRVVAVGGGDGRDESVLAIPISVRGKTIGVLDIHKSGEAGEWTPEEMSLVERVSDQLGVALESARLYQDTQRRAAREQLTGEVTARMRETLDVETVLKTAADEMYQALGLDEIVIRLATEGMNVSLQ